ncbi:MAG TPA: response regulator, partial [Thermoanaerobaculia bacterium]|nr:response regulator [Thermoanaerobaculia bacterium]
MSNKILVVDDDRALQLLLEVLFSRAGFDVDFAGDGKEAMTKIASGVEYQTIVLDLVLPEISGKEILDLLERDRAALLPRVIVLSGASR